MLSQGHEIWRTEQARYAIIQPHKVIALSLDVREETVSRWNHGAWPLPVYRAFELARCQDSLTYLQRTARRFGYVVSSLILPPTRKTPIMLLANFASATNRVIETLIRKRHNGERLTAEEAKELHQLLETAAQDLAQLHDLVDEQTEQPKEHP